MSERPAMTADELKGWTRILSELTGQPDAEQCIHRIGAPACRKGLGCGCMRGEAPELPDAGRDPDTGERA